MLSSFLQKELGRLVTQDEVLMDTHTRKKKTSEDVDIWVEQTYVIH